jgi:hypothetical protein
MNGCCKGGLRDFQGQKYNILPTLHGMPSVITPKWRSPDACNATLITCVGRKQTQTRTPDFDVNDKDNTILSPFVFSNSFSPSLSLNNRWYNAGV